MRRRPELGTLAAFLFAAVLLLARLGALPLVNPDEGRNAEIGREVAASGAWLVPTYDGLPYLDKPIFLFKAVGLALDAFGVDEAAARLPSALFALATLALLFAFCRRAYGSRDAALAVAVVAGTPLFLVLGRYVVPDMPLAFFVVASVLAGWLSEETEGRGGTAWRLAGAAAAGAATLVKGPVGFVLPFLILSAYWLLRGRPRAVLRLVSPAGLAVFLAVTLPWFVGLSLRRPDFPYYGLVRETFVRFTRPAFHRGGPIWYYVPVLLGVCFGWSVLYPEGAVRAWRRRADLHPVDLLFLVWAVVVTVFFSVSSSKLPGYVLTAAVALGVLVARLFGRALDARSGAAAATVRRGVLALAVLCLAGAALLGLELSSPGTLHAWFGAGGSDFDRARRAFPALAWSLGGIGGLALLAGALRRIPVALAAFLLVPVFLETLTFGGLEAYAESASARELAGRVRALAPGVELACDRCFPTGLPFYLRKRVSVFTDDGAELTSHYIPYMLRRSGSWPAPLVRLGDREAWLAARRDTVLLLARPSRKASLDSLAADRGASPVRLTARWWGLRLPPPGGG